MFTRTRIARIVIGLIVLVAVVVAGFAVAMPAITRWGATDAEVTLSLPDDESLPKSLVDWTTATTIDAPPDRVWPWIAQIGNTRGGFYSYTFIENQVGALMGADYHVVYHNADQIVPEWQNPQPGEQMIQGVSRLPKSNPTNFCWPIPSHPTRWAGRGSGLCSRSTAAPRRGSSPARAFNRRPALRIPSCSSCSTSAAL